jgi:hypothetical protein
MGSVRVYKWELYDAVAREFVAQPGLCTEEAIRAMHGVVMYATVRELSGEEAMLSLSDD